MFAIVLMRQIHKHLEVTCIHNWDKKFTACRNILQKNDRSRKRLLINRKKRHSLLRTYKEYVRIFLRAYMQAEENATYVSTFQCQKLLNFCI